MTNSHMQCAVVTAVILRTCHLSLKAHVLCVTCFAAAATAVLMTSLLLCVVSAWRCNGSDNRGRWHKCRSSSRTSISCHSDIFRICTKMRPHDGPIITAPLHCCGNANSNSGCPKTLHVRGKESYREYDSRVVY